MLRKLTYTHGKDENLIIYLLRHLKNITFVTKAKLKPGERIRK